jgi:hypothetical protein
MLPSLQKQLGTYYHCLRVTALKVFLTTTLFYLCTVFVSLLTEVRAIGI